MAQPGGKGVGEHYVTLLACSSILLCVLPLNYFLFRIETSCRKSTALPDMTSARIPFFFISLTTSVAYSSKAGDMQITRACTMGNDFSDSHQEIMASKDDLLPKWCFT